MKEECFSYIKKSFSDPNVILLTADLGFGMFEDFETLYPKQFINLGIAEQLMASICCGLSHEGFSPIAYSIGNFPTFRCLEQIRNDIIYHNSNVKIITNGAGFSYGGSGMSHHATEDIGIIRSLPESLIFSPASSYECKYLIACDGSRSFIRNKYKIPWETTVPTIQPRAYSPSSGVIQHHTWIYFQTDLTPYFNGRNGPNLWWIYSSNFIGTIINYDSKNQWVIHTPYFPNEEKS